ncbi:MAG: M14 family zinc carboxypeptidase [Kofleriaceae bacterium]
MSRDGYRGLAEVTAAAIALGARLIGASRGGRPIHAITVGARGPTSLVVAGLHPLEWIGVEVALAVAARAAAAPPVDRRVVIVPALNVDGIAAVEADRAAGRRRWRRTSGADRRSLGVDLNRNFPVGHRPRPWWWWGLPHGGPAPLSEPETRALAALLDDPALGPVDRAVSLHSFGRAVLLPWAHRGQRPPHHAALRRHAAAIAARLPHRYRVWQVGRWRPFRLGGLEVDWLTARGALAMVVECSAGGWRATAPATWLAPFAWYNPPAPAGEAADLAAALTPFVLGAP